MKIIPLLLLLVMLVNDINAQQGYNIPLVVIETNGGFPIPDEPKIRASMKIIDNGPGQWNYPSDSGNVYDGYVGIEIRGRYSASLPQKPYGFETRFPGGENLNVSLLGMPEENDWILLANYNDKSFLRNAIAGHLFRRMGHYAPRTVHCEVIVNNRYDGIYVLTEKIKRDRNRVDISRLDAWENTGDAVTGGYIFKTDYYTSEDSWASSCPPTDRSDGTVYYVYHYPEGDEISPEQKTYLQTYIDAFDQVIRSPYFRDPLTGYTAYLDVVSFRDYFILSEVSRNVDAYKKSRFFFKDRDSNGGKIHSGPPWDYDWAWKNIWDCEMFTRTDGSGWAHEINTCDVWPIPPMWMSRLLKDDHFKNNIKQRYVSLRHSFLSTDSIFAYIDSITSVLNEAQKRHYSVWDILGENVGAHEVDYIPSTFEGEMNKFKNWIQTRLAWLDLNMPGDENGPVSISDNEMPILRVFPNPATEIVYIESDKLISRIELFHISGARVIFNRPLRAFSITLDVADFIPGLYVLNMVFETGESISHKLVIK